MPAEVAAAPVGTPVTRTVVGDVASEQAGITLAHEHILYAYPGANLVLAAGLRSVTAAADPGGLTWRYVRLHFCNSGVDGSARRGGCAIVRSLPREPGNSTKHFY
jgi:predicted metal-dependent phosphotriesterase family hydrolase